MSLLSPWRCGGSALAERLDGVLAYRGVQAVLFAATLLGTWLWNTGVAHS